jgi:hypothetical protein
MRLKAGFAAALMVATSSSLAAQTKIQNDPQTEFRHNPSGIVLASSAAGIPRASLVEYDDKQLDFAADFHSADAKEVTTIYIFRKVTGDVPLWFDRIQRTVEARDVYANPVIAIAPAPFTPAGQANARGLLVVYTPGVLPWKSSGAALTTVGEWFVAVRASSQTLTPEQLQTRLQQTFAALKWPQEKAPAQAAVPIALCSTTIDRPGKDAEPVKDAVGSAMASALTATMTDALVAAGMVKAVHWCRDSSKIENGTVYRPQGVMDRFLVAIQDAGRGIWAAPTGLPGVLIGATSNAKQSFMVEMIDMDRHTGLGNFQTLPTVGQAIALSQNGRRTYIARTWGDEKKHIEVFSDGKKK